jgi:hypothetical protein
MQKVMLLMHLHHQLAVNDAGVSIEESLWSAYHSSVSAQHTHMMRSQASEMAKFWALDLKGGFWTEFLLVTFHGSG